MSEFVINTKDESFEADVFTKSEEGLVVLDFWADWCAPCRMLAPILEGLAEEMSDDFTLVKAETEQNQAAAEKFQVSAIPAVFAVFGGEILGQFSGGPSEDAFRQWIEEMLQVVELVDLKTLRSTKPEEAETRLKAMLDGPHRDIARLYLAEMYFDQENFEESRALLEQLQARGFLEPDAEKLLASLDLADQGADVDELRKTVEQDPANYQAQLALASALAAKEEYQEVFDIGLQLVTHDRKNTGEKARELMVKIFRILGDESELTREYRRKLSMALY